MSFHFFEFKLTIGFIALLKEQSKDKSGLGVVSNLILKLLRIRESGGNKCGWQKDTNCNKSLIKEYGY
ncbi:hypothetical protein C7S20_15295 [Christiangramia fulva]|uniref:Uncharacterized protein n=1 Tax=Christiangramia fulva TaxID=2126553 RepID=A0A2R3Z899_9FLAO|nr:hypothetical protein C7S20_15295 [Christiangramia fulva]